METIAQIRQRLEEAGDNQEALLQYYQQDTRKGVQNLIAKYYKQQEKIRLERARLLEMRQYEMKYEAYHSICGVDEAGRGPLAGPVVAGAVILPPNVEIMYLNDSKKLSASRREALYEEIKEKAIAWSVAMASPQRIDEINILQATYEAMKKAVASLMPAPDLLLVDAVHIPGTEQKQVGIIKGDAKSVSIAAASIMAKVTRDRLMVEMDALYPQYGFASHKGYGSKEHIKAIKKYGPCPIHRQSFIKNFVEEA